MKTLKLVLALAICLLGSSCSKEIGSIIFISESENYGLIEHHGIKQISKYDLASNAQFELQDIVHFELKNSGGILEVKNLSLAQREHYTKWWHQDGFHIKTHIRPTAGSSQEFSTFNNRSYKLMEVRDLDEAGNPNGPYKKAWIPMSYILMRSTSDFNNSTIHFMAKLVDQSGNIIKVENFELGIEVLENHPPH